MLQIDLRDFVPIVNVLFPLTVLLIENGVVCISLVLVARPGSILCPVLQSSTRMVVALELLARLHEKDGQLVGLLDVGVFTSIVPDVGYILGGDIVEVGNLKHFVLRRKGHVPDQRYTSLLRSLILRRAARVVIIESSDTYRAPVREARERAGWHGQSFVVAQGVI